MLLQMGGVPGGIELLIILIIALLLFGIPLLLVAGAAFLYIRSQSGDDAQPQQYAGQGGQAGQVDQQPPAGQQQAAGQQSSAEQGVADPSRQAGQSPEAGEETGSVSTRGSESPSDDDGDDRV
jgi:sec-independent protein translocase protein TatA